jgi:hypothetical protein
MWLVSIAIVLAMYPLTMLIAWQIDTRRRRARYREVLSVWRGATNGEHEQIVNQSLAHAPRCAAAWYLQGVLHLRNRRTRRAAMAFGMAYHCDCNLESAALLTFTCLKTGDSSELLDHANRTWIEMKRPEIGASFEEGMILQALGAGAHPLPDDSAITQLAALVFPAERSMAGQEDAMAINRR